MESIFGGNDPNVNTDTGEKEPSSETLIQLKTGANWFYWIAGLSLVNSAIFAFGGQVSFIAGLAVTQIIDAFADGMSGGNSLSAVKVIALVMDFIVFILFALIGYYANKAINAVFIGGMVLYIIDGLVWLLLDSFLAFGFHIFALIMIFRGFMASREIARIRSHNRLVRDGK